MTDFELLSNSKLPVHYSIGLEAEKASKKGTLSEENANIDDRSFCLLRCKLHTDRTHQIRVHAAHIAHPLVGDAVYGGAPAAGLHRQALHACEQLGLTRL
jgi:23S rRNA-/tRNA-specific pseudouridylate synthase